MSKRSAAPDAAESNAGDDFHLLWAARRAIKLLEPYGTLKRLGLEGVDGEEAEEIDRAGDQLLGIDVTEYHGGSTFPLASSVVVSQLKYSTRRPTANWTAARLTYSKNQKKDGSVIHRLAQVFTSTRKAYGRDEVLQKLRLELVTNQPIDPVVANAVTLANTELSLNGSISELRECSSLSEDHQHILNSLAEASRLPASDFCDFIRVVDLSKCGAQSRLEQELTLLRELGQLGYFDASRQFRDLKALVHRMTLPESRGRSSITADDVAAHLGIADRRQLFPCPARFDTLHRFINRRQMPRVVTQIVEAKNRPICIHAAAGMGKTSLVRMLEPHLPDGSVAIVFDCYGAGSYLVRADMRHGHSRAITQIANELATRTSSSLLLAGEARPEEMLRLLLHRMTLASTVIRAAHPDALVAIIIDAADNSIAAGQLLGDASFVPDLTRVDVPEGCRLVVTCRTHRRAELLLPRSTVELEIEPFTEIESEEHLRAEFAHSSPKQCQSFHQLSRGIPRVQVYARKAGRGEVDRVIGALQPNGKTVELIIDTLIDEAAQRSGSQDLVDSVCQAALALPRPIPLAYLALLSKSSLEAVADVCTDLHEGLVSDGSQVVFRDEDFETHLRDRFTPSPSLKDTLANLLLERRSTDTYAAAHIADALALAGRNGELVDLVLHERQPQSILDPIVRHDVFARRARLALHAVLGLRDRFAVMRVLFVLASAAKTDSAVEDLLLNNADLACRYGDAVAVQRLYLSSTNDRIHWHGATHWLCAVNFARNSATQQRAIEHLESARGWLQKWLSEPEEQRDRYSFSERDVANATEAILRLKGPKTAERWLCGWRPREFVLNTARQMLRQVLAVDGLSTVKNSAGRNLRFDTAALLAEAALDAGLSPPPALVESACNSWVKILARKPTVAPGMSRPVVLLAQAAAAQGIDHGIVTSLLNGVLPEAPTGRLELYSKEYVDTWDTLLRAKALLSLLAGSELKADDRTLRPKALLVELPKDAPYSATQDRESQNREFDRFFSVLVPAYTLHARQLLGEEQPQALPQALKKLGRDDSNQDWLSYQYDRNRPHIYRMRTMILADACLQAGEDAKVSLDSLLETCGTSVSRSTSLQLAEKVSQIKALHPVGLKLIDQVHKELIAEPVSAKEQTDVLISCSRIAGLIDAQLGRHYFDLAVAAAAEIDEEAIPLLRTLSAFLSAGQSGQQDDRDTAIAFCKVVEACHWRIGDSEHFPWSTCIRSLVASSPGIAAAAVGRWDQRGILDFDDHITDVVAAGLDNGSVSPEAAIGFSVLANLGSERAMALALDGVSRLPSKTANTAVEMLTDHAVRIAPMYARRRMCETILDWLTKHSRCRAQYSHLLEQVVRLLSEPDQHVDPDAEETSNTAPSTPRSQDDQRQEPVIDVQAIADGERFVDAAKLEGAIRALGDPSNKQDRYNLRNDIKRLLTAIMVTTNVADHLPQLESLFGIDEEVLDGDILFAALKERLVRWRFNPLVRQWTPRMSALLAERRFSTFFYRSGLSDFRLEEFEGMTSVGRKELLEALLLRTPFHVRALSAQAIYDLAASLVGTLTRDEAQRIAQWQVSELFAKLDRQGLSVAGLVAADAPERGAELEAAILYFLFGHPDRRRRWAAIHAARRIVQLDRHDLLSRLANKRNDSKSPFVAEGTAFYWLAAKHSYLILIDELTRQLPNAIVPLSGQLLEDILAPQPPHALHIFLAKRSALELVKRMPKVYPQKTIRRIRKASVPVVISKAKAKLRQRAFRDDYRRGREGRYYFDSTDTLPYWYAPIGERFGVQADEFCSEAESWILDRWDFAPNSWQKDPVRHRREGPGEARLRSHSHGSVPTIEDLRTYLELNAMFCVAYHLANTKPILPSEWSDGSDPWNGWMRKWDVAWSIEWLADRRQTAPLERTFWFADGLEYRQTGLRAPTDEDFDRAVGLLKPLHPGYFVADGDWSRQHHGRREHVHVDTALVSAQSAQALLVALASSDDPMDYRIPDEGDDLEFDEHVDGTPFVLKGWISQMYDDSDGFDKDDPLRYQLPKKLIRPSTRLTKDLRLTFSPCRFRTFKSRSCSTPFSIFEHWSDGPERDRETGFDTDGHRLWMQKAGTQEYLRKGNWQVIVKCVIRRDRDREGRYGETEDITKTKLYLIDASGDVVGIRGRDRVRPTHR